MDRVYRLQLEFSEISQKLARTQIPEYRHQLSQRKMEIIAEASELFCTLDARIPIQRAPAGPSSLTKVFADASD